MKLKYIFSGILYLASFYFSCSQQKTINVPLRVVVDLNVGEPEKVRLSNGGTVEVVLLNMSDSVDDLTSAVRQAYVQVAINGQEVLLNVSNYYLPVTVGNIRIDCPVTKAYKVKSKYARWGLEKDARLRIWLKDSPLLAPGTFVYPIRQRFLANDTHMANEPVYVNGEEAPGQQSIYYHSGLDFGGFEGKDKVLSAVDGIVITAGLDSLPNFIDKPEGPHYDCIYILDKRGWFHGYFHLFSIDPAIRPGVKVKKGQKIATLGKEGGSGGWAHLHYVIKCRQPSGKWGDEDAYAYIWEAYASEYKPPVIAVARPHHFAPTGKKVTLDGRKSKGFEGEIVSYEWTFTDGTSGNGPVQERTYTIPGTYSEVLKVIDSNGNIDYDYVIVQVIDEKNPDKLPPVIHAVCYPTSGIKVGDPIIFGVRTFRTKLGNETWVFGDGSPSVNVISEIPEKLNTGKYTGKYAETIHRYEKPGHYIVRVERTGDYGYKAISHLHVEVEE